MTRKAERGEGRAERPVPEGSDPLCFSTAGGDGASASEWSPVSRLRRRPTTWLSEGRWAYGTVSILEGRKTAGKGTVAATLAACMTGGIRFSTLQRVRPHPVLWLGIEESAADAVGPKVAAAGGNPELVICPSAGGPGGEVRRMTFPTQMEELARALHVTGARLVVIDPISSFVSPNVNLNDELSARSFMEPFVLLARTSGALVLMIRHLRKGSLGCALDAGIGSVAIANSARSVLRVDDDPDNDGMRLLSVVAVNDAEEAKTLRFRLEGKDGSVVVVWEGESDLTAEDLAGSSMDAGERDARADARCFLKDALAEEDRKVNDLQDLADLAGIAKGTLRRAKRELGITSHPVGSIKDRHWVWRRPEGGFSAN